MAKQSEIATWQQIAAWEKSVAGERNIAPRPPKLQAVEPAGKPDPGAIDASRRSPLRQ
jgi:hypothetical protein